MMDMCGERNKVTLFHKLQFQHPRQSVAEEITPRQESKSLNELYEL